MPHHFRSLLLIALIIALPLPVGVQAAPSLDAGVQPASPLGVGVQPGPAGPSAPDTAAWYDGLIQYSTITNCVSIIQGLPYQEYGAGAYVGFLADPDAGQPAPNTTYYVHVFIAGLGNSCSGMRAYLDLALPASTSLAIDPTHHVYCLFDGVQISPASDCPQSLPASPYNPGAYALLSTDGARANTWPVPQGHTLEFQVPVKSSVPLTNSALRANVWMLDGNSSPWLRPQQGVYVFSSQPTIIYPSPSTNAVTATSGHSQAYLYAYNATGIGYFDLGTTASYGLIHEAAPISSPGTAWLVYDDWGPPALTPDTLYHWRFTFTTGSQTYYGADQTFSTLPDGRVTVGQGHAADCTEAAFNSALATAKEIAFDCGPLPVTITLTSAHAIASNLTINGGNKVTLASNGAGNHFNVQGGAHLTLTQITLSNGLNTAACGGAVRVLAGAQLTLNDTRFINNASNLQGGAVCNSGSADISATLFKDNSSKSSHGGAIGNYGTLSVNASKFINNKAAINGGGIDMGGSVTVVDSTFTGNGAGFRGGGINSYGGTLVVAGSNFTGNSAALWGGGLASDASTTSVSGSTFSGNSSTNIGGGLETSGTGSLTLTNITVSGNQASTDGGGLYWTPGAGQVMILNSTIANNQAGTQGGNIYTGGVGGYTSNISLKNTLVGSGVPNNCSGTVQTYGNNLENTNTCGLVATGDKINLNPNLGPLQNNGGATATHALRPGSLAVDAGANNGCPATDQRGVARPIDGNRDGSAVCDIGAFEAPPPRVLLPLVRK
jgi:hypothetical protein